MRSILSAMLCSLLILAGCSDNKEEPTAGTLMEESQSERDATADTSRDITSDPYAPAAQDDRDDMASDRYREEQPGSDATDRTGELGAMESGEPAESANPGSTTLEEADTMIEGSGNP